MRKSILTLAALLGGVYLSSASVTVQGWWHLDNSQPINDSSGNSRTFGSAYSTAPATGGQFAALLVNNGVGGPLDGTGWISTSCIQVGVGANGAKRQSAMWGIGYNPPAGAYGIEIWVLPQDNGIAGGSGGWIFSSGQGGGVALRINAPSGNPSYIDAFILGPGTPIGDQVLIDTNHWMHLAIVDDAGVLTFYTNGVPCGASVTSGATTPAGDVYIGTPNDNQAYYGYLDEARMFTFAPGAFSTNDLLLRPAGPIILGNPRSKVVWNGGAATFSVNASFDPNLLYQWQRGGANQLGQTAASYYLNSLGLADDASTFDCILTSGGISQTSTVATLSMVSPNASNVAAYRDTINGEPSLLGYFPVDSDTGATLTNTKDPTHNGTLELGATYDGQTNATFGARSLSFNGNGDVQIPNNPAFEFGSGNGTIEALVYMSQAAVTPPTIFSEDFDNGGGSYSSPLYTIGLTADGNNITYANDAPTSLTWNVPGGLVGKLSHVAVVIDNLTNVTAYVNGLNLGTKQQTGFGTGGGVGYPFWIGGLGTGVASNRWVGNIDELSVYGSALSQNEIQLHYSKFYYGTNTSGPSIVSQPGSKTLFAGGSPLLVVKAVGTLPLNYQWSSNAVPIAGATSSTLALSNITTSATYSLSIQNAYGTTNTQPIVLTVEAPPSGYPTTVMNDHPTAFWRLADTAGPTAVDSAGLNDGTYNSGGVTYAAGGAPGDASAGALFDGSSGRALVPNSPAINSSGPFTIEFWASLSSYGFFVPLSSMDRPARTSGYEYYIAGNSPGYEFHTAEAGGYSLITADNNVPPNGTWTYVTGIWDGTNMYLYVNGTLGNNQIDPPAPAGTDNFTDEGLGQTEFIPNTSVPFYIASRSDNTHYFHGTIADIAYYNYALTRTQVTNHWSYGWSPANVVQSPTGVTNVEGSTITLTATVTGVPNTYQWFKGTTPLSASLNFDGTAHYPSGVTGLSLAIAEAQPSDSGDYHLAISNPVGGANTANATVLITPDTNKPAVISVVGLGTPNTQGSPYLVTPNPFLVRVNFNKRMDPVSGAAPANYVLSPPATVSAVYVASSTQAAAFGGDYRTAYLQTTGLTPGTKYSLTVSGVKDQAQTPNTIATSVTSFRAPVVASGKLWWDYYYPVTPQGVASLLAILNNPPYGPQTNATLTAFDTDQITGGDLNNNPAFGSGGDNYGDSLSGWITPTVSGDYTFFLASDDNSELLLSSNADPLNAQPIATEPVCCHGFLEPGNATAPTVTSTPQTLSAGTPYFIQALHTEGGGGDYVKVAWRLSTDTTASTNLLAIGLANPKDPASDTYAPVLSSYAPVPPPSFGQPTLSNGQLTLPWNSYQGTIYESSDLKTWTAVPGNPNPLVVPVTGPQMFYRLQQ